MRVRTVQDVSGVSESFANGVLEIAFTFVVHVRRGADLNVNPIEVVAEHIETNLSISDASVQAGSWAVNGELRQGILHLTYAGGSVEFQSLGRVPEEHFRIQVTVVLEARRGIEAAYRLAVKRLRRAQRLLSVTQESDWPVVVTDWEASI